MAWSKRHRFLPLKFFVVLLVLLVVVAVTKNRFFEPEDEMKDRTHLIQVINSLSGQYAIPKSDLEWFVTSIGLIPPKMVTHATLDTTVTGTVKSVRRQSNVLPTSLRHYYVGNPGYYAYDGAIELETPDGTDKVFYFSPQRMTAMRVSQMTNHGSVAQTFDAILVGTNVEITETVDLALSNINDDNLLSLTVKILP